MIDAKNYEEYLDVLDATYCFVRQFKQHLKDLTQKLAKFRDLGDDLVKSFNDFLSKSQVKYTSLEFQRKYCQLSQCFSIVEDNRDAKIERLDTRLCKNFDSFLDFMKLTRYKRLLNVYKKELNQQYKNFNQAAKYTETPDMINLKFELKILIENFEKQKVQTFDKIFKDYLLIQLSFCTEATKVYSNGYKSLSSSVDESFSKNMTEMTKGLYRHNFESALLDLTTSFDQLDASTKTNSPKYSKKISDISSGSVLSFSSNDLKKIKDTKKTNTSNSIFGILKLTNEDSDDALIDQKSTENSSEEEDSYETRKRKIRLEYLHSLTETEV